MPERCFYRIEQKEDGLFKKANEFLDMEEELCNIQKNSIESQLPKFSKYKGTRGFNRIVQYTGFVFDDQESIDPKVWNTKEVDGKALSTPNRRTKVGKAMDEFLRSFKRTTCWDVDRLLGIDETRIVGSFCPADLFRYRNCVYVLIDSRCCDAFERNNPGVIEITYGEMMKVIDSYNAQGR